MQLRVIWRARSAAETIRFLAFQLAALVAIDRDELRADGPVPSIYAGRVRYRAEVGAPVGVPSRRMNRPPEDWRDVRTVLAQGYGDCEDLVAARTAELQLAGQEAIALPFFAQESLIHCIVWTPSGIEDPSADLGMRTLDVDYSRAIADALQEVTT